MLRRRIAGTVCSVAFAVFSLAVVPGVAAALAPAATSAAPSSAASADPSEYPAQGPQLTVSSGSVQLGGSVVVTGRGFQAGEGVDLSVTYTPPNHALGSGGPVAQPAAFTVRHGARLAISAVHTLAASDGTFSTHVPLTQAGNATITATGEKSHLSLDATVSVLSAASAPGAGSTGSTDGSTGSTGGSSGSTGGSSGSKGSTGAAGSTGSIKSTKRVLPFASVEFLIGALAIVFLLFVVGTAWQRRSRKPSAAFDTSTT